MWLSWNNEEEGFQVPIMPGSVEIGEAGKNKTYDVAGLGEINVLRNPKLTDYSFSSFFPGQTYPFVSASILLTAVTENGVKTNAYVYYLKKWMESKRPIHFIFTGDAFDLNISASIESFDYKEVAGGSGDIEYSLKLKKYVFYAAQKVTITRTAAPALQKANVARANDRQSPKTYTLKAGDNLWKVAKLILGDGARYKEIQTINKISDARLMSLPIGMVIKLPQQAGGFRA
jgi:hypothetical protein